MDWKEKLGINEPIKNEEVANYLQELGFQKGKMDPRYADEAYFAEKIKITDAPCMILETKEPETGYYATVFINDREAYVEKSSENSFATSNYVKIDEELTLGNIDEVLNELLAE